MKTRPGCSQLSLLLSWRVARETQAQVYTINLESRYLIIQGVPAVGAMKELVERFALYGTIEEYNALDEYPAEDFTEVYLIKFMNLQRARVAKKKMDEQSFFGGLLHVCYAPEFETVEETRKKLEERQAYIARTTKTKDYYKSKKKMVPEYKNRDFRPDFYSDRSGFCAASLKTSGNSSPCLPYSCELPLCYFASRCTCSSGEHMNRLSHSYEDGSSHNETGKHCNHTNSSQKMPLNNFKNSVPCLNAQKALISSEAVDRFMPRTTQLQERKRRRDDDRKLGTFLETSTSTNEVMIGPKLPDIPKVDLQDDSLNTTANLIRNKLKEVISSVPKPPDDKLENLCPSRPLKQRRRI
ncbi:RNA-binding protein 48 isoform X2 [Perognathus longimembris pacificus]|uniref:RNA-binding protein 48 isoform X2 n=1 Tax=Perognathus longimembris pacificus TaxID=214514 RepID=UPI0020189A3F|nr:RNA-binding protein 48 isoform X2 [Perognathus longimembris pacificus]